MHVYLDVNEEKLPERNLSGFYILKCDMYLEM